MMSISCERARFCAAQSETEEAETDLASSPPWHSLVKDRRDLLWGLVALSMKKYEI